MNLRKGAAHARPVRFRILKHACHTGVEPVQNCPASCSRASSSRESSVGCWMRGPVVAGSCPTRGCPGPPEADDAHGRWSFGVRLCDRPRCPRPANGFRPNPEPEHVAPDVTVRKRPCLRCSLPDQAHAPEIVGPTSSARGMRARNLSFETHADRPRIPCFRLQAPKGWALDARPCFHLKPLPIQHKGARHPKAASRLRPLSRFRWSGPPARKG